MEKSVNEIEVIDPIIISNQNSVKMETKAAEKINLSDLNDTELEAELKRRNAARERAQKERVLKFEKTKEAFVRTVAGSFKDAAELLLDLKQDTIKGANDLFVEMYEMHGKEPKEQKSFSLTTADDQFKVEVERAERFEFTEEASVHINSIKDIFKAKFEGRNKGFYNLLDSILMKGTKGEYDPKLLTKARNKARELNDDELMAEFDKLQGCQRVVGSSMYCRAYARDSKGKYQNLNVQFSSL